MSHGYRCHTAFVLVTSEDKARRLSYALEAMNPKPIGVATIVIEAPTQLWEVGAYFDQTPNDVELQLISAAFEINEFQLSELPPTDWVAKVNRDLTPVKAGQFWIYFSHNKQTKPTGLRDIKIASSMAFGTGHHGSTQGCLVMFDKIQSQQRRIKKVADVGCGSGVLSIAACQLWQAQIVATDIDEVAVEVTSENIMANQLDKKINTGSANGLTHQLHTSLAPFDLIIANILLKPLVELASEIKGKIHKEGSIILSGIMTNQESELRKAYQSVGFNLYNKVVIDEWVTLQLGLSDTRPNPSTD